MISIDHCKKNYLSLDNILEEDEVLVRNDGEALVSTQ